MSIYFCYTLFYFLLQILQQQQQQDKGVFGV
jgi:hypothetical protein